MRNVSIANFSGPGASIRRGSISLFLLAISMSLVAGCSRGPDISTPKKSAAAFAKALETGDMATAKKTAAGSEADFTTLKNVSDVAQAGQRYQTALTSKFGDKAKPSHMAGPDFSGSYEDGDEKITGDTATVAPKEKDGSKGHPLDLKKDSDGWKVDLTEMGKHGAEINKNAKSMIDAMDATTKEVQDGKFKTADEASMAMGGRMMSAAMGH